MTLRRPRYKRGPNYQRRMGTTILPLSGQLVSAQHNAINLSQGALNFPATRTDMQGVTRNGGGA